MNLRDILSDLLVEANKHVLNTQQITLFRGLTIKLYVDDLGNNHLALTRPDCFPSLTEWMTVIRAWPQPLPTPAPEPVEKCGKRSKALVAVWRVPQLELARG